MSKLLAALLIVPGGAAFFFICVVLTDVLLHSSGVYSQTIKDINSSGLKPHEKASYLSRVSHCHPPFLRLMLSLPDS